MIHVASVTELGGSVLFGEDGRAKAEYACTIKRAGKPLEIFRATVSMKGGSLLCIDVSRDSGNVEVVLIQGKMRTLLKTKITDQGESDEQV